MKRFQIQKTWKSCFLPPSFLRNVELSILRTTLDYLSWSHLISIIFESLILQFYPSFYISNSPTSNQTIISDGTVDCEDSECCKQAYCATSIYCMFSNDPVEVLLRKQPPSVTASFYQRVKFLVEENSVQSYPQVDEFSER